MSNIRDDAIQIQSSYNTITNNIANNNGYALYMNDGSNNTITNNIANNNSDGFISLWENNTLMNNIANNNTGNGFYVRYGENTQLINNTANNNGYDGFLLDYYNDNTQLINNTANNNYYDGFASANSWYMQLTNNTANDNGDYGFYINTADNSRLINNTANNNIDSGISIRYSWYMQLTNNTANENSEGFEIFGSDSNQLINNTANDNSYGFSLHPGSTNNTLTNNTANDNIIAGIHLGSNNNSIINSIINTDVSNSYGINFSSSGENKVYDTTISTTAGTSYDIYVSGTGQRTNYLINCTFNQSSVIFDSGTTDRIAIQWYLDVYVNNTAGSPINQANVTGWNVSGTQAFTGLTTSNGYTSAQEVTQYTHNISQVYPTTVTYHTNYTLNAFKSGEGDGQKQVNLTQNTIEFLTISMITPTFSNNATNTTVTGAAVNFTIDVTDNALLDSTVGHIFSTNNSGTWINSSFVSFTGTSKTLTAWNATVLNLTPSALVQWKFYANDTSNSWNASKIYNLTTTPGENPKYFDNSTNDTYAGHAVVFNLSWTDDIGLSGYIFSFDNCTGSFANDTWQSMTGTGNWSNVTKVINSTVGCTIRWKIYANDISNNWNVSKTYSLTTTSVSATTTTTVPTTTTSTTTTTLPPTQQTVGVSGCSGCYDIGVSNGVSNIIESGENGSFEFTDPNLVISEIIVTTANTVTSPSITVTQTSIKPDAVDTPAPHTVYGYLIVTKSNITVADVSSVKIKFRITKAWISENIIDERKIALHRYSDDEWTKLTTDKVDENATYIYFEAISHALSVFSITAEKLPQATTTTAPLTIIPIIIPPELIPPKYYLWIVGIVITVIIVAVLFWKRRTFDSEKSSKLISANRFVS